MVEFLTNYINVTQLEILGFRKKHQIFVIFFFICLGAYLVIKPIITFLSKKEYIFVLSYLIISLLMIMLVSILTQKQHEFILIQVVFDMVVLFGFVLSFYLLSQFIKRMSKN